MLDDLPAPLAEDGEHGGSVGNETNPELGVAAKDLELDELALQPAPAGLAPDDNVVVRIYAVVNIAANASNPTARGRCADQDGRTRGTAGRRPAVGASQP
jgi:hypothetical protein